ncbi:MAG: hypothetical protein ACE5HP_08615 [Gemmatimonadota bacterium]
MEPFRSGGSPARLRHVQLAEVLAAGAFLAACGGGDDSGGETLRVVRDTVGDTAIVRTLAGSAWGEDALLVEEFRIGQLEGPDEYTFGSIQGFTVGPDGSLYVVDGQPPALRKYAPDGTYLVTFG